MLRAHSCEHGNSSVDVVVYDNLPFSVMITMQATDERCDDLVESPLSDVPQPGRPGTSRIAKAIFDAAGVGMLRFRMAADCVRRAIAGLKIIG